MGNRLWGCQLALVKTFAQRHFGQTQLRRGGSIAAVILTSRTIPRNRSGTSDSPQKY